MMVELTNQEAESFKVFRKHQGAFETMHKAGVFDIQGGSADIHFNDSGILSKIVVHSVSYKSYPQPALVESSV